MHTYRRLLMGACNMYPSSAYAPFIHAPKGGLLTLGRTHFEHTQFTLYRERGLWYTFGLADWVLHKGILCTCTRVQDLSIRVLNTHLNANYDGNWSQSNRFARGEWSQLQQLAEVVATQPTEALVLVAGDFNVPRGSWLYRDFLQATSLIDPLADDARPTFRGLPWFSPRFVHPIDFILFRAPPLPDLHVQADLTFQQKLPLIGGGESYLSDHVGVVLRLTWSDAARTMPES